MAKILRMKPKNEIFQKKNLGFELEKDVIFSIESSTELKDSKY